ncbi:MAG: SIMPL domain-containing protein [Candidatus Doudnabacteria bacterium]|nr:SIMPL domain-containing protein [Candidatus Doudnabacteria bacterium]
MQTLPKWLVVGLGGLLIAFVALSVADKAKQISDDYGNKNPQNTMTVSAEGKVKAVPDMATVTLGVVSQGSSAADVQSQNSQKINKIVEFIKQQGVNKDDVSTSQFNVYPRYDYAKGTEITGYEARQTITVKVKGVDESTDSLGKILSGAASNGANEVNGVNLSFEDADNLRQEARQLAIEKAKLKAEELAKTAGIRLGKVISVSEDPAGYNMPYYADGFGGGAGVMMEKAASPNIEPGSQDVVAQMNVVFEVK